MADAISSPSTATLAAGLIVAGLGAVYAYAQYGLGALNWDTVVKPEDEKEEDEREDTHGVKDTRGGEKYTSAPGKEKHANRRKKAQGKGKREGEVGGEDKTNQARGELGIVPGDFNACLPATPDADAATTPSPSPLPSAGQPTVRPKRKKNKKKGKVQHGDEVDGPDSDADVGKGPTDASTRSHSHSHSPTPNPHTRTPPQPRAHTARVHAPPQPASLALDTDSSWTHVRGRGRSGDDERREMEVTSSDVASTTSGSPAVERMEGEDMRGTRARDGADGMLARPEGGLARVLRVQPPADEMPVPGFSWDDYGDVLEESLLVHDADQEDEGEWGIVKSRHRTRPTQTTTNATSSASSSPAPGGMTKKQRQNARKRELVKTAKAETEAARLEGLAKHKRELERLRIIEQSQQGGGKHLSGGMQATVDDRGKLVWE